MESVEGSANTWGRASTCSGGLCTSPKAWACSAAAGSRARPAASSQGARALATAVRRGGAMRYVSGMSCSSKWRGRCCACGAGRLGKKNAPGDAGRQGLGQGLGGACFGAGGPGRHRGEGRGERTGEGRGGEEGRTPGGADHLKKKKKTERAE